MTAEKERFAAGSIELDAKHWIAEAKQTAASIHDDFSRSHALSNIAITQAKAGDLGGAKLTAAGIRNHSSSSIALREIAIAQVKVGDLAGAKLTAGGITDHNWMSAFSDIAVAQAKAGELAEAKHTFEQAKQTVAGLADGPVTETSIALSEIARAQAKAGDLMEAKLTATGIAKDSWKGRAFSDVAAAKAKAGDLAEAKNTFKQAKQAVAGMDNDDVFKSFALSEIAAAEVKAGDLVGAQHTAAIIYNCQWEYGSLLEIAAAQAKAGDLATAKQNFEQARGAAAEIPDWNTSIARRAVIAAQTKAGDVRGSVDWANDTITDPMQRVWAFLGLAEGLMPVGFVDEEVD